MGIDPGIDRIGWAAVSKTASGFEPVLKASGLLHTSPAHPLPERLEEIFTGIREIIRVQRPACLAVEDIYFMKRASSVAAMIQARGVILLAARISGCMIESYNPRTVKMTLTGNGNAGKAQMQRMARMILHLKDIPKPDDVADAIAIALCHMRRGPITARMNDLLHQRNINFKKRLELRR